jgi:hypothetical protein
MSGVPVESAVLVIVPTHDHASTLGLAVRSALEQTVTELDVVIIGDGVGDDTRSVVDDLVAGDPRVRFVDRPKSPSRAERARHEVITASSATIVTYLGDDDLLLPDHVEIMQRLLEEHDFAHPFPIVIDDDDRLRAFPTDLADPRCVAWHLHPRRNTVSLTGAAHTTELYRRVPLGWQAPPPGRWPDHYMWEQFLRLPDVRLVTSRRATTIKPPASPRPGRDPGTRRTSLQAWWDRMHQPDFRTWWDSEVTDAVRRSAIETYMDRVVLGEQVQEMSTGIIELRDDTARRIAAFEAESTALRAALEEARAEATDDRDEASAARADLELVHATRTWRLHDRLSALPLLRRLLARRSV